MSRYGTFQYGTGTTYGVSAVDADPDVQAFRDALGAPVAARPVWRRACAEIWTFDTVTWLPGIQLPYVEAGASRSVTRTGPGFEQQSLSFTVSNAAYYLTGAGAGLLDRGQALCIRWGVESPEDSTFFIAGVFQIDAAVSPTGAAEGSALNVSAVDWMQPALSTPVSFSGWINYPDWTFVRDDYVGLGKAVVDRAESWGTMLAALLDYWSYTRVRVDSWPQTNDADEDGAFGTAVLQVGDAGQPVTGYDVLTWFWPKVGGFVLGYDSDGYLRLMDAKRPRDSGYFISTDTTVTGALALPWERPLQVQRSNPSATRITYLYKGPASATPEGASGTPAIDDPTLNRGNAESWSRVHPHRGGVDSFLDTEQIVESGSVQEAAGFATFNEFCRYRLADLLGGADTLSVNVDSAFPPGPTGRRIRVHAPADDVDGYYVLAGYTQPLTEAAASWQLRWLEDA